MRDSGGDFVRITRDGGVMTLTLARPEKKNAINNAMFSVLADALDSAASDPDIAVVVLAGEGDNFTAGNDLDDFLAAANPDEPPRIEVRRFGRNLITCPKPVVVAVKGHAVGIGTTLLLHCDLVYVAEDARLKAPFISLGLVPELASTRLMMERIGYTRAFEFFTRNAVMDGLTAERLGIATRALRAPEVDAAAHQAARELVPRAAAVIATKKLMRPVDELVAQSLAELEMIIALKTTPAVQGAVRKLLEGEG